jgi:hypothetical protein
MTPITGTGEDSWSASRACAVLVLHAMTIALTPSPSSHVMISRLYRRTVSPDFGP